MQRAEYVNIKMVIIYGQKDAAMNRGKLTGQGDVDISVDCKIYDLLMNTYLEYPDQNTLNELESLYSSKFRERIVAEFVKKVRRWRI